MFTIGLCSVLAGLLFVGLRASLKAHKQNPRGDGLMFTTLLCIGIGGVGLVIFLVTTLNYSRQINDFASVQALEEKVGLYEMKRDNLSQIVRFELSKYPEFEKDVIENINPAILLKFPELKSNQTMVETLQQLLKLENEVYTLREDLIDIQRTIYAREISPWVIYVTPYEDFLSEKNPVGTLRY